MRRPNTERMAVQIGLLALWAVCIVLWLGVAYTLMAAPEFPQ